MTLNYEILENANLQHPRAARAGTTNKQSLKPTTSNLSPFYCNSQLDQPEKCRLRIIIQHNPINFIL